MNDIHVPVLVAGGGTVGLAAAVFLAHHGVRPLVVEWQDAPSIHPRATGVGQRTVELLREVGLEDAVNAVALDMTAGALGKISGPTLATVQWPPPDAVTGRRTPIAADTRATVGPARLRGLCPQNRLDPVLLRAARERGATVCHGTELVSFEQDADGVTAVIEGPEGRRTVRADYLVAADGVRSGVRAALGIDTTGPGALGDPMMNILFRADLDDLTHGHHFVACDITGPSSPGMLVTVDGRHEWIFHVPYEQGGEDGFTPERCRELIRAALGDPERDVEVLSRLPWRVRAQVAERFSTGRVFLAGDAAHANPPLGAFGMNTGVADAHNLAWKLAWVLRGQAGPGLLATYEAERRPVAELTVRQALLRLENPRLHWDPGMAQERAKAGVVNAPVVHLGYRYDSTAVVGARPELPSTEDVALDLDGSPGSRLPHLWVEHEGRRVSTLDLVGSRFTLLTGPAGAAWLEVAGEVATRLGAGLHAFRVGADGDVADPEGLWPAASGTGDAGALLVRPDGFVAWRSAAPAGDDGEALAAALLRVLHRPATDGAGAPGARTAVSA
ncbi:FAD-dependent monooxygenase [Sphaerisporangium fuscum]|uniref:FAD-dependent monooxygenase n=1 Tax=Sphaerisporangium fuscum TaxID=2835868 RepID=UPI001BDBC90C|nr:FAD-dependent monooxygenase [Sphaerisporangium fuscum]